MGLTGQSKESSNFERTLFPEGTYDMVLDKALVLMGKPTKFQAEGAPKIMFIWKWTDDEGQDFELVDYLGFPKNMKWNEKSAFWKRAGEIAGLALNNENAGLLDLDLGEFIQSYAELVEHIQGMNDQGKPEKAEVKSLTVDGQELLGKKCRLVVGIWNNGEKEGNEIAKVMQIAAAGGPKKPMKAAPAPAAAPQQKMAPARPAPVPAPVAAGASPDLDY
ncbi:hypothetical protein DEIPH_ctg052orf0044 [Deinococcus phoenicis]|uniref:DUF669 domain-containing protein n=1 Tax=Deinococcus phoenicis TaxID=1476583 RepID=A0A016QM65_9DEIO|nr:hypothetical protein [Deinococcus phoenicis]EYB67046.1 hypothetical protein DEIPH_ctg052orf0044 [Deinococcus phoenicis]